MKVSFYESVAEHDLKFAVIISRYLKQWVFCKRKQRKTFEIPGGHRENGKALKHVQDVNCMKKRELLLIRLNVFATTELLRKLDQKSLFGTIFYAEIEKMAGYLILR